MSTLRKLTALIHRNLHCQVAGGKAEALTIHSNPTELLARTKGWLPDIVGDLATAEPGLSVKMIAAAALGPLPGMAREGDVPKFAPLPARADPGTSPDYFLERWTHAIDALRLTVHNHAQGVSDHSFVIALWLAASVLTAQVVVAFPAYSPMVVYIPADMPADPIGDRTQALEVARLLQPQTLFALPLYQRVQLSAITDAQLRLRAHADTIRLHGKLASHAARTEFKHLLYFMENASPIKLPFAEGTLEGDMRAVRQQHYLVQHRHAATLADAKEMLRRAHVQPQHLSDGVNYGLTHRGKVRYSMLLALALRRENLLRPEVFAAFGRPSTLQKIAARLREEGLSAPEIQALCGVLPRALNAIEAEVNSGEPT